MKFSTLFLAAAAAAPLSLATATTSERKASVYIQHVTSRAGAAPQLLAEIQYDPFASGASGPADSGAGVDGPVEILSYEAPEFDDDEDDTDSFSAAGAAAAQSTTTRHKKLLRVGIYDPSARAWTSSTSVASADNFGKGYSPQILLSVDARTGDVVGAALKGVRIDAGQTRDFGPRAVVLVDAPGKQPELNKPVVLAPNGKKVEPEPEKTMLQK